METGASKYETDFVCDKLSKNSTKKVIKYVHLKTEKLFRVKDKKMY